MSAPPWEGAISFCKKDVNPNDWGEVERVVSTALEHWVGTATRHFSQKALNDTPQVPLWEKTTSLRTARATRHSVGSEAAAELTVGGAGAGAGSGCAHSERGR